MNPFYYTNLTDTDSHRVVNLIQFPFKRKRSVGGYQHATACTTSMPKRNVDDVLSRVDLIMKKYRADKEEDKVEQEKYEKEQEKYEKEMKELQAELDDARLRIVELENEDDEEDEVDEEEKGGDSSTPKTICYSP